MDEAEEPGLKLNADGVFVHVPAKGPDADVAGELRWDLALRRRCFAMDVAGLCSFEAGMLWHEAMKAAYLAAPPPGYRKVTWAQLLSADRALFKKVSEGCPGGCKAKPGETVTEFEKAWKKAIFDFEVRLVMQALPCPSSSPVSASAQVAATVPAADSTGGRIKRLEHQLKNAQDQLRNTKRKFEGAGSGQQWSRSKGGGKASGKRDRAGSRAPPEMHGKATRTKDNEPICFAYNIQGCSLAQPGQRCPKGWHVCAAPQCQSAPMPHSMASH